MRVTTLRETRGATTAKAAAAPSPSSRSRSFRHGGARRAGASRHLRRSEGDLVSCRSASEVSTESPVAVEGIDLAGNEKEDRRTSTADILRFALPALGVFLSSPLMSLIDTVFVGAGGNTAELAALSPGTALCDNLVWFFNFLWVATTGLVASNLARGKDKVREQVQCSLYFAALLGVFLSIFLGLAGAPMMRLMGVEEGVLRPAMSYVAWRGVSMPFQLIGMACNAALLGIQDARACIYITMAAAAVNFAGDFLLCYVCNAGLVGAAIATSASIIVYGLLQVNSLARRGILPSLSAQIRRPKGSVVSGFVGYGGPYLFVMSTRVTGVFLVTSFAAQAGAVVLAAHQILMSTFYFLAAWGEPLGQCAQSMMPPLLQRKDGGRIRAFQLACRLGALGAVFSVILGGVGYAVLRVKSSAFTSDVLVQAQLSSVAWMMFFVLVLASINVVIDGVLLSMKDLRGLCGLVCLSTTAQMGALFTVGRHFGLKGVWIAMLARLTAWFLAGIPRVLCVFNDLK